MINCLLHATTRTDGVPRDRHPAAAKQFEAAVEANLGEPLYIPELCRMVGVPARSLNAICREQFGMSAQRFLALRRLYLARRVLLRSDHRTTAVTTIAMDHGVWQLGQFAEAYKAQFGESPSATLRRTPES